MIIREAGIEDALSIANVQVKTWRSAYRGIVPDDYLDSLSIDKSAGGWAIFFSDTNKFAFVALDRYGNIVGFASMGDNRTNSVEYEGELYALYILDEYQRKDIGKKLFSRVLEKFSLRGIKSMLVCVLKENHSARHFYESAGGIYLCEEEFELGGKMLLEVRYGWKL